MKKESVKKIAVFDQGHPVFWQLMTKAKELFGGEGSDVEFLRIACESDAAAAGTTGAAEPDAPASAAPQESTESDRARIAANNPMAVISGMERVLREEEPDMLLMGATALGEEVAPALGIRLRTGVAAHCTEIRETEEGRIAFMVPAFGGKVIGEIFIPGTRPAIATVKPGMFTGTEETAGEFRSIVFDPAQAADPAETANSAHTDDPAYTEGDGQEPSVKREDGFGSLRKATDPTRGVELIEVRPRQTAASNLDKADVVVCGGFGIGSAENWQKIELLAQRLGGAAGCTRPVVDMGWGPDEESMIGTSGRTIRPKVYLGFGISGAAHHLCGIRDAGEIISINSDKDTEGFAASDHIGVFDAGQMLDQLLQKTE